MAYDRAFQIRPFLSWYTLLDYWLFEATFLAEKHFLLHGFGQKPEDLQVI